MNKAKIMYNLKKCNIMKINKLETKSAKKHVKQIDTIARAEIIDSIIWFGFNYNYSFIRDCWGDDPCLANHLKDKFSISNNFTHFISMLCDGHREKLYNYILKRYSKSKGHFKSNL